MRKTKLFVSVWLSLGTLFSGELAAQGVSALENHGLNEVPITGRIEGYSNVGLSSGEFLSIQVGGRGVALGDAYIAGADDISAIWWNPAGLGFLESPEMFVTVVDYTLNLQYYYLAGAVPVMDGKVVVGGFMGFLNSPPMEVTTVTHPQGTGEYFDSYDMQAGATLAYNFSDRFSAGINLKWVHEDIWNITGNAAAFDLGANYHTEFLSREIRFGFVIQNLGSNLTFSGSRLAIDYAPENDEGLAPNPGDPPDRGPRHPRTGLKNANTFGLPSVLKGSVCYTPVRTDVYSLTVEGGFSQPSTIPVFYTAGGEFLYHWQNKYVLAARMGWRVMKDEIDLEGADRFRGISFGWGLTRTFSKVRVGFDYAYRHKGRLSADNFFSVSLGF
ncbi:MAG: PorV/PorQ family protein [Candidatus Glassbacteria bacterium]|nr:PorV/PorQ family protein [Candidatus Glassbacteria bacterium]